MQNEFEGYTHENLIEEVIKQFESRIEIFPEGQIVDRDSTGGILGSVAAMMVSAKGNNGEPDYSKVPDKWNDLTANGYFSTHDEQGNLLVCCAINVPPKHSGKGVPRRLLHAETYLARERGLIACPYTRPVNFREHLETCGFEKGFDHTQVETEKLVHHLEQYLEMRSQNGRHKDKNVGLHEHFGAKVLRLLPNGREKDTDSCGFCILMAYPPGHVIPAERARENITAMTKKQ